MNSKTKKRLFVVSGILIMVLIFVLASVGGNTAAKTISIAEAASGKYVNQKVQVSGSVVDNSFETVDKVLKFDIYDPEGVVTEQLHVVYDGSVSATFGNGVIAICTGKIGDDGTLRAGELVTKCPSKYENATNAISVAQLQEYGEEVYDKPVKVAGIVAPGTLGAAGHGDRFILVDKEGKEEMAVEFEDALSEDIKEGSSLVITGSLRSDKKFVATNVALEG